MEKVALCFKTLDEVVKLNQDKEHFATPSFISREICEDPANGYLQIIPYISFFNVNIETGKLMVLQYKRPDSGEGEMRLAGKTSVGFGGHIDQLEDISSEEIIQDDNNVTSFKMNIQNLITTCFNCAKREIKEELNIDLEEEGINVFASETGFFQGSQDEDVGKVHLGFTIQVLVNEEQLEKLKASDKFNPKEIEKLELLGINLDTIIEEFDTSAVLEHISGQFKENGNMEDWSVVVIAIMIKTIINNLKHFFKYSDFKEVIGKNQMEAMQKAAQESQMATQAAEVQAGETQPAEGQEPQFESQHQIGVEVMTAGAEAPE